MKILKAILLTLILSFTLLNPNLAIGVQSPANPPNPQEAEMMQYLKAGAEQVQTGKFQEAIEPLKKVLELKPDTTKEAITHYLLGVAYTGLQKADEAIAEYKKSVSLKGDFLNGQFALGKACFAAGQFEDALAAYKEVVKLDPKSSNGFFSVGATYVSLKRYQEAIEPLQQSVKLQPKLAEGHYYLGQVYLQLANKEEADKELEVLKSLNSPLEKQLAKQMEKFAAATESKEIAPGNTKIEGRFFVGIAPIKNVAGVSMPINEMRARVVRRVLNAYFDCTPLDGENAEKVINAAKDQKCDYVVYTEILAGIDERPQTDRVEGIGQQTTTIKVKVKLLAVGSDKPEFETTVLTRENKSALGDFTGLAAVDTAIRDMLNELRKKVQ